MLSRITQIMIRLVILIFAHEFKRLLRGGALREECQSFMLINFSTFRMVINLTRNVAVETRRAPLKTPKRAVTHECFITCLPNTHE